MAEIMKKKLFIQESKEGIRITYQKIPGQRSLSLSKLVGKIVIPKINLFMIII